MFQKPLFARILRKVDEEGEEICDTVEKIKQIFV